MAPHSRGERVLPVAAQGDLAGLSLGRGTESSGEAQPGQGMQTPSRASDPQMQREAWSRPFGGRHPSTPQRSWESGLGTVATSGSAPSIVVSCEAPVCSLGHSARVTIPPGPARKRVFLSKATFGKCSLR